MGVLLVAVVAGNAVVIIWLWVHGGNLHPHSTGDKLTSAGRLTGLLGAYLALIQVVLLARLPVLERLVGFDRLTVWHRWNGHACIDLIIAHVVLTVWGYSLLDRIPLSKEISTMLGGGIYPGMITATIGTAMLIAVVATSIVIVRRRLRYEWWYAVHLMAYAGIALSWFHEIPTGNELVLDRAAANYWRGLYVVTIAVLAHLEGAGAVGRRAALPAEGRRGGRRGARGRVAADNRPQSRPPPRPRRAVLPLALPHAAIAGAPLTRSRCPPRPAAARSGSR